MNETIYKNPERRCDGKSVMFSAYDNNADIDFCVNHCPRAVCLGDMSECRELAQRLSQMNATLIPWTKQQYIPGQTYRQFKGGGSYRYAKCGAERATHIYDGQRMRRVSNEL